MHIFAKMFADKFTEREYLNKSDSFCSLASLYMMMMFALVYDEMRFNVIKMRCKEKSRKDETFQFQRTVRYTRSIQKLRALQRIDFLVNSFPQSAS